MLDSNNKGTDQPAHQSNQCLWLLFLTAKCNILVLKKGHPYSPTLLMKIRIGMSILCMTDTFINVSLLGKQGVQWLSDRMLDSRPRVTCPCLTERLLMGRKESNQTNILLGKL